MAPGARPRLSRAAAILVAAFLVFLTGCSEQAMSDLADALGSAYDAVGPGHLHMSDTNPLYQWRYEMYHGAFAGDPWIELNGGRARFTYSDESEAASGAWSPDPASGAGARESAALLSSGMEPWLPGDGVVQEDPPGWNQDAYPGAVDGGKVWRRLRLLPEEWGGEYGTGNLYCCTAYAWEAGIAPSLGLVREYLDGGEGRSVLYRMTAVFSGLNDIPEGFLIEARSVGDDVLEVCRYVYNVQPGIGISYEDGSTWMEAAGPPEEEDPDNGDEDTERQTECEESSTGG